MTRHRLLQIGPLAGLPGANEQLATHYDVIPLWKATDRQACLQDAADIEVIVTTAGQGCKREVIEALPNLKAICSWGVGYDTIDVATAHARGVAVTNTPDVLNDCVADQAWGLLIACARKIAQGDRYVRTNAWETKQPPMELGTRVSGKKLGIVGLGRIGLAIARRGLGFDMDVRYHNRNPRHDVPYAYMNSLLELANWADFLVVATVGGSDTQCLINRPVLQALGPRGFIINIARGTVIDQTTLVELLTNGELGGAGLDVFEKEPFVPDALKHLDQVVLMPHVASATVETRSAMAQLMMDNVAAHFAGKPLLTPINPA